MKCSKLLKEAFEGINFTYKLNDVVGEIPANQKFNTKQMVGYLTKRGVSPKEIKAAGLEDWFKGDYPLEGFEWQKKLQTAPHQFKETDIGRGAGHDRVTLSKKGEGNPTYKETLMQGQRFEKSPINIRHYGEFETPGKSLLGWRRTHVDEINGKQSTVLNEWQSDWAQELSSRSREPQVEPLLKREGELIVEINQLKENRAKSGPMSTEGNSLQTQIKTLDDELTSIQSSLYYREHRQILEDFPMSPKKFHQYQIVASIDEAIKNGTKRVVIPIERENELVGSEGVTKFYDSLNIKILPEIRKKLEAQGMKLNVHKEGYGLPSITSKIDEDIAELEIYARNTDMPVDISKLIDAYYTGDSSAIDDAFFELADKVDDDMLEELQNIHMKMLYSPVVKNNRSLHVIDIEEIPNKPIKWDVYSTLGAIGLGSMAEKLKEQEKQ